MKTNEGAEDKKKGKQAKGRVRNKKVDGFQKDFLQSEQQNLLP